MEKTENGHLSMYVKDTRVIKTQPSPFTEDRKPVMKRSVLKRSYYANGHDYSPLSTSISGQLPK